MPIWITNYLLLLIATGIHPMDPCRCQWWLWVTLKGATRGANFSTGSLYTYSRTVSPTAIKFDMIIHVGWSIFLGVSHALYPKGAGRAPALHKLLWPHNAHTFALKRQNSARKPILGSYMSPNSTVAGGPHSSLVPNF